MVVSVSETFTHSNTCTPKQDYKEQELEKIILKMMKKNGISPNRSNAFAEAGDAGGDYINNYTAKKKGQNLPVLHLNCCTSSKPFSSRPMP